MITAGGLLVPDPPPKQEARGPALVLSGNRGIRLPGYDNGYYGDLIVSKNGVRVPLRITHKEYELLSAMGIEEYT